MGDAPCVTRSLTGPVTRVVLHSPSFRRPAPVVGNRRDVLDGLHLKSGRRERLDRGLATAARAPHAHMHATHAGAQRLASRLFRGDRRRKRGALLGPLEARLARRTPRDRVPVHVRDRDRRVVEGRVDVRDPLGFHDSLGLFARRHYLVTFFLPAIARRGPFLVRALVCVRCPRTGRPRRWRTPRYEPMSISRLMFMATSVRSAPSTL